MGKVRHDKLWAVTAIGAILSSYGVPFVRDHMFHPTRLWKLDFAILPIEMKVAIEYEGGQFIIGRHQSPSGFEGDIYKYNAATLEGWTLCRLTTRHVEKDAAYVHDLVHALAERITTGTVRTYHRVFSYKPRTAAKKIVQADGRIVRKKRGGQIVLPLCGEGINGNRKDREEAV